MIKKYIWYILIYIIYTYAWWVLRQCLNVFKDPVILMLRKIVCIDLVIPNAPNLTLIYLNGGLLWEKSCKTVKSDDG